MLGGKYYQHSHISSSSLRLFLKECWTSLEASLSIENVIWLLLLVCVVLCLIICIYWTILAPLKWKQPAWSRSIIFFSLLKLTIFYYWIWTELVLSTTKTASPEAQAWGAILRKHLKRKHLLKDCTTTRHPPVLQKKKWLFYSITSSIMRWISQHHKTAKIATLKNVNST